MPCPKQVSGKASLPFSTLSTKCPEHPATAQTSPSDKKTNFQDIFTYLSLVERINNFFVFTDKVDV